MNGMDIQLRTSAIQRGINTPDQLISMQNGQHVIAIAPLYLWQIDLALIRKIKEESGAAAIGPVS